jgi:hypothetical protein
MNARNITGWIRAGLWALAVSNLVTAWATLEPQPDQTKDPDAWARFVSADSYLISHLFGSTAGTVLVILGVFALGCFLAGSRAGPLALPGMVMAAAGSALLLVPAAVSTFTLPAIGKAYLAGNRDVMALEFPAAMQGCFLLGLLLAFVGNVLLGTAVWGSRTLPRWAGAAWLAGVVLFYLLGVVLGQATTGSSLPTQTLGALVMAAAASWIAWSAARQAWPARTAPVVR